MAVSTAQINGLRDNLIANWWQPTPPSPANNFPRILPTEGGGGAQFGHAAPTQYPGTYWQMAQMLRFMVDWCRVFPTDTAMNTRVNQQASYIADANVGYNASDGMGSTLLYDNGLNDSTINVSDDAAWKMLTFCDLHRITGDGAWLDRARIAIPKILSAYQDPNGSPVNVGNGLIFSAYGILYGIQYTDNGGNIRRQDTYNDPQTSLYEAGLALAALYVYEQTLLPGYLAYAQRICDRFTAAATDPAHSNSGTAYGYRDVIDNPGAYYVSLHLVGASSSDAAPLHTPLHLDVAPSDSSGHRLIARNGLNPFFVQGTMAVGVLCARLYRLLGSSSYLDRIKEIVAALGSTQAFKRADGTSPTIEFTMPDGNILNNRDPFTAGFFACDFVREVLFGLRSSNVDPGDKTMTAFAQTGTTIVTGGQRTINNVAGYYSADWGSPPSPQNGNPLSNGSGGTTNWDQEGRNNPGGQASPDQIMVSANSGTMALAGYMAGTLGTTLYDGSNVLTDQGSSLIEG